MKYHALKWIIVCTGISVVPLCFGYFIGDNPITTPEHLSNGTGGIAPFTVSGAPSPVVLNSLSTTTIVTEYTDTGCTVSLGSGTMDFGSLTLTSGHTYYFSQGALNSLNTVYGPAMTRSVGVSWGSTHVSNLCMQVTCAGGNCTYSGSPGSVVLS